MKKQDLLFLLISTCLLTFFWIGFNIYHNLVTPTITTTVTAGVSPISPIFDTKTFDDLKTRSVVQPLYESSASGTLSKTPTPSATPSPSASPSATPQPPSATPQPTSTQ